MTKEIDISKIPEGPYCYVPREGRGSKCPYWSIRKNFPIQMNGFCSYLMIGDWMPDSGTHLWDQVKECSVNWDRGPEINFDRLNEHLDTTIAEMRIRSQRITRNMAPDEDLTQDEMAYITGRIDELPTND